MKTAYLQMHLAILLWGFTGILGKAIGMSEGMIVWYRLIISAAGLLPFLLKFRHQFPSSKQFRKISLAGALIALHWVFFYGSIKASNVSIALSCFSSVSLFTAILDPISRRERPKTAEIILGIAVILGIYIIFSFQKLYLQGIILAIISSFLGASFTVMNKKLIHELPAGIVTFFELLSGFILLSILLPLYFQISDTAFQVPGTMDWIYLLLLGLICTSFAFTISLKALKQLDAFTLNLSVNLEPLYSIILAIILFNEAKTLNTGFFAGTFIILASVVFHSWYKWRLRSNKQPQKNV
jgi:drug/metabolite transporter (DMT)-like permease